MFTVGQLITINPDLIPVGAKEDDLIGDLGFPALFRHATFEILEVSNDETRGPIVLTKMTNPEIFKTVIQGIKEVKYEGELILLQKDVVLANMKLTLDYIICQGKTKEQVVKELFVARKALEAQGLDKRHKAMRDNWKKIEIARGNQAGVIPEMEGKVKVLLPKHKKEFKDGIEVDLKDLPTQEEESIKQFQRLVTSKIRESRNKAKFQDIETKVVFGISKVQKMGGVYLQEKSLLKAYEEMMKTTLETDKKPTDAKANYVGIEIEFIYSGKYDTLKKLLIENKLHRYVCLKSDGSVKPCHNAGAYQSRELTLICKNTEVEDVLKRLDGVLAHPEIDGYANRSCGLHVHLDMRNRDASLVYKNMVRVQNILRGAQPVGRVTNTYCKANDKDDYTKEEFDAGQLGGERYLVVNPLAYSKQKSIEIRIHEGTTDCEAIYNWVSFLDAIASHKTEIPKNELKFAEDLVSRFDIDIPPYAIDYVDRRIERFKSLLNTAS